MKTRKLLEPELLTRQELVQLFQPNTNEPTIFDIEECKTNYKQPDIHRWSIRSGTLLPKEISSDRDLQCDMLDNSIHKNYNTQVGIDFNSERILEQIAIQTGVTPQEHQVKVAKFLLSHRGLLAIHRTGTGKTFTAILSILLIKAKYPNLRIVVLLPASLKSNFVEQMIKIGISPLGMKIKSVTNNDSPYSELKIEIYSFDEYYSFFKKSDVIPNMSHTFLIVDEAHQVRSQIKLNRRQEIRQAQRSFTIMTAASQAFRVLLLTATPFINSNYDISNLLAMVKGIAPNSPKIPNRLQFNTLVEDREAFYEYTKCLVSFYYPGYSDKPGSPDKPGTEDYPKQINMPLVIFTMNQYYYDKYKEIEEEMKRERSESFYRKLRLAEIALDGEYSPKIDWVVDFIVREAQAGRKSVVFSNWIYAGIHLIRRRLDLLSSDPALRPYTIYAPIIGEISSGDRTRFKDLYNSGVAKIMLISRAGSEGLDLTNTRNVIILESNWNASTDLQIIGRAVRYRSHHTLPPEERIVRVWRLLMRKPPEHANDYLRSIDEELYSLSYDIKLPLSNHLLALLKKSSIEENECPLEDLTTEEREPQVEQVSFSVRTPRPVYREIEYEYVAPETSALAQPEELSEEQYKRLAGLTAAPEQQAALVEQLQQVKEQATTHTILPIYVNEEEWI